MRICAGEGIGEFIGLRNADNGRSRLHQAHDGRGGGVLRRGFGKETRVPRADGESLHGKQILDGNAKALKRSADGCGTTRAIRFSGHGRRGHERIPHDPPDRCVECPRRRENRRS